MREGRTLLFAASAVLAVLVLAWLYREDAPLRSGVAFHHIASVRELARGDFPPRHNLVAEDLPQPHYGPYLVGLGALARMTGRAPLLVLHGAGILLLIAHLLAVRALARRLLGGAAAGWSVLAVTLLWGPWPAPEIEWEAWGWPGTTSLADAHNFFYPQHAAGVLLACVVLLLIARPRAGTPPSAHPSVPGEPGLSETALPPRWPPWGAAVLVAATLVATHPLTGFALAVASAALALAWILARGAEGRRLRAAALILAVPPLALLLATLWPYYPMLELLEAFRLPPADASAELPGRSVAEGGDAAASPAMPNPPAPPPAVVAPAAPGQGETSTELRWSSIGILGPAFSGLGWAMVLAARGRPFLLAWAGGLLLLSVVPQVPLRDRLILFAALPLHVAACGLLERGWSRGGLARMGATALLLLGALSAAQRIAYVLDLEVPDVAWVESVLPMEAVVLADARTSNMVAGLTGRKIVAPEGPDMLLVIRGGWQRVKDVDRFLSPRTDARDRAAILARWKVTHVLVDTLDRGGPPLPYPVAGERGGYRLYDVRAIPPATGTPQPSAIP